MNKTNLLLSLQVAFMVLLFPVISSGQVKLYGTVYDAQAGGKIDEAQVNIFLDSILLSNFIETDRTGQFMVILPRQGEYRIEIIRPAYSRLNVLLDTKGRTQIDIGLTMKRLPGYELSGTIRELIVGKGELGDEIKSTRIEVYNATTGEEVMNVENNSKSTFNVNLERGNRYVVLIRKNGYFAKRFEVLINVDGCILCFEGLGSYASPNIIENLANKNEEGMLLTDIGLRPIKINEAIRMDNIYYDLNKWNIRSDAQSELDKLVRIMRATPIIVELSSHTDSRASAEYNETLSQKRAQAAVDYIIARGIASNRITAQGYGESQLVNNCSDDVKCSEAEHQKNRRTEFKVTRLMEKSSFDSKTLKTIIEAEKLNKIRQVEKMVVQ